MANTCGDCQMFNGSNVKCDGGHVGRISSTNVGSCFSFKGPSSLFDGKKCGGCRLFEGLNIKCGGGHVGRTSSTNVGSCPSYTLIPG